MPAPQLIIDLIDRFERNSDAKDGVISGKELRKTLGL
jgi:hypothetical protein